jgi:DNA uptake protein ComE-like DNA-binding protein
VAKAKIDSMTKGNLLRALVWAGWTLAAGLVTAAMAQDFDDMAALNEQASKLDPEDYAFMQPVCTRCHTPQRFLHARTWPEWLNVFEHMRENGAVGSKEQWDHIHRYVQRSLTLIEINHADEDELSAVLGVDEKTAIDLVRARSDRKFETAEDVEAVPGVDKALIEQIKSRLVFGRLRND